MGERPRASGSLGPYAAAAAGAVPGSGRACVLEAAMTDFLETFFQRLRHRANDLAPELGRLALERGLAVTGKDGEVKPIPITATPVVIAKEEIQRRVELSARITSAAVKMAGEILSGPDRDLLAGAVSPVEKAILEKTEGAIERLATARVDYFVTDRPRALELNTT